MQIKVIRCLHIIHLMSEKANMVITAAKVI